MSCPSCIRHVKSALMDIDGVGKVGVKVSDGLVLVRHDTSQAPIDQLITALGDAGYTSKPRAA